MENLGVENSGVERPGVGRLEVTSAQLGGNDDKEGAVEDEALSFLPELGCSSAGALSCWVQLGPASKDGMAGEEPLSFLPEPELGCSSVAALVRLGTASKGSQSPVQGC